MTNLVLNINSISKFLYCPFIISRIRYYNNLMQRNVLIGIGLIIVLLLGGAYFLLGKSKTTPDPLTANQANNEAVSEKTSFRDLLAGNRNVTCTTTYPTDENTSTNGTIFVSGKRMRGDFNVTVNGKNTLSYMIQDGTYVYVWTSDSTQGTKMKADAVEKATGENTQNANQNFDVNKEVDVKCSNWSVDESKFTPPANVTFTDLSQILQKLPTSAAKKSGGNTQVPSSACDSITYSQAKEACIKALNP